MKGGFDEIGYWSELKLEIVQKYAQAYSTILSAVRDPSFWHVYIDGFAGAGFNVSRSTGELVPGSPLNALRIVPPFREFFLVDLDGGKADRLRDVVGERREVHILEGDCNTILVRDVFPMVKYEEYRRGLCLLDPYGLDLNWEVIAAAGHMRSLELFLNFPVMDMNRNVLWSNPDSVDPEQSRRMTAFWGDESWRDFAYATTGNLFGWAMREPIDKVVNGFRERLKVVAGFDQVPEPIPMRNSKGAVVYYLFFASQKPVAGKIVKDTFQRYRNRGAV
ncbi:MAG: three-Cys-motif partner protein TcmP [Anaerolineales bacterium]|jgi:three-Cys-motif partner protein